MYARFLVQIEPFGIVDVPHSGIDETLILWQTGNTIQLFCCVHRE